MKITPTSATGIAASDRPDGRSRRIAQASSPTRTTCKFPSTVARPAPTSSIPWCQATRSTAKMIPAIQASARCFRGLGP